MDVWLNKFHLGIIELDSFRFYTAEKRASDCVKPRYRNCLTLYVDLFIACYAICCGVSLQQTIIFTVCRPLRPLTYHSFE